ncbi:hypothetical protein ABPG72_012549 [Tetrahymena utriculariae]
MDVELNQQDFSCDLYSFKQIQGNWQPIHKIVLKNFDNNPNLFFIYFNNSYEHFNLSDQWREDDFFGLFKMLYKLYKSKIEELKGIWGILSLKYNRKNGLVCYQKYNEIRTNMNLKKETEQYKQILKKIISSSKTNDVNFDSEYEFEIEFNSFKKFIINDLDQICLKLSNDKIEQICKIIGVDYLSISLRVKTKVEQLLNLLEQDTDFNKATILKKDPKKDIERIKFSTSLVVKAQNIAKENDQNDQQAVNKKKNNINVADQQNNQEQNKQKKSTKKRLYIQDSDGEMETEDFQNQDNQQPNKGFQQADYLSRNKFQKQGLKRRTQIEFQMQKPIFDGYDSEPELSFNKVNKKQQQPQQQINKLNITCPAANQFKNDLQVQENLMESLELSQINFSTEDNISQFSYWSQQQQEKDMNDIDDKYDFGFDGESFTQQNKMARQPNFIETKDLIENSNIQNKIEKLGNSQYSFFDENSVNPFEFENKLSLSKENIAENNNRGSINIDIQSFDQNYQMQIDDMRQHLGAQKKFKRDKENEQLYHFKKTQKKQKPQRNQILCRKQKKAKLHIFTEQLLEENDANYQLVKERRKQRKVENAVRRLKQERKDPKQQKLKSNKNIMILESKILRNTRHKGSKNERVKQRNIITQDQIILKSQNKQKQLQKKQKNLSLIKDESQQSMINEQDSLQLDQSQGSFNRIQAFGKQKIVENDNLDSSLVMIDEIYNFDKKSNKNNNKKGQQASGKRSKIQKIMSQQKTFYSKYMPRKVQENTFLKKNKNDQSSNQDQQYNTYQALKIIEQQLITVLQNQQQLIYYYIKDIDQIKNNVTKDLQKTCNLSNNLLEEATKIFKIKNFTVTYKSESEQAAISYLLNKVKQNQIKDVNLNEEILQNFQLEFICILRNQTFWNKLQKDEKDDLIQLLYLFVIGSQNEELKKNYYQFVYNNYIMNCYKLLGLIFFDVIIHLIVYQQLGIENPESEGQDDCMETEIEYREMLDEDCTAPNSNTPKKECKQKKSNFASQDIHETNQNTLRDISKQIIVLQEMSRQLNTNSLDFERQINLFASDSEDVTNFFSKSSNDQVISERYFEQYPNNICSLNADNLDISMIFLHHLFYAEDVTEKDVFINNLKKALTKREGQLNLTKILFEQSPIQLFSIFQRIYSQIEKNSILVNLIDINKKVDRVVDILHDNTFVSNIEISSDLITKIMEKVLECVEQNVKDQLGLQNEIYMQIFQEIEKDEENLKNIEIGANNKTHQNDKITQTIPQLIKQCAFLIKYPSELLERYFMEDQTLRISKNQLRLLNSIQSSMGKKQQKKEEKEERKKKDEILIVRDILIIKVFIKNSDLSNKVFLPSILKLTKKLVTNPKENVFTARTLIYCFYVNLLNSLDQQNYNSSTSGLYNEIFQTTYTVLSFLIEKYNRLSNNQAIINNTSQIQKQNNQQNIQMKMQIQKHREGIQCTVLWAFRQINYMLIKSYEFIKLFIENFLSSDDLINLLNPNSIIHPDFRYLILQMFYSLYQYPNTILNIVTINQNSQTVTNLTKQVEQIPNITQRSTKKNQTLLDSQNNSNDFSKASLHLSLMQQNNKLENQNKILGDIENYNFSNIPQKASQQSSESSDDDDEQFAYEIKIKDERNKKLNEIHTCVVQISMKVKKNLIEYITQLYNQEAMKKQNKIFHPDIRMIEMSFKLLGCVLNSQFQQQPQKAFESIFNLLLQDKPLFMGEIYSESCDCSLLIKRYNLLFHTYKEFLDLYKDHQKIIKESLRFKSETYSLEESELHPLEKFILQAVVTLFIKLLTSYEGNQVQVIYEYIQNLITFIDRIFQYKPSHSEKSDLIAQKKIDQLLKVLQKTRVFTQVFKIEKDSNYESELDIIKLIIKNVQTQLQKEEDRYLNKFIFPNKLFIELKQCITDTILKDVKQSECYKFFNRTMYFLTKLIQINPEDNLDQQSMLIQNQIYFNNQIKMVWNQLFMASAQQDFSLEKFELDHSIMLKQLIRQSRLDFKSIIKFCLKSNYTNFILKLAIQLKSFEICMIIKNSNTVEEKCSVLLRDSIKQQLDQQQSKEQQKNSIFRTKLLNAFIQDIQQIKFKYYSKDDLIKNAKINTLYKEVLKILMQVEEQNKNGAILNNEKVIQQQMISTFIYVFVQINQMEFITVKNENQTHLQRKELENMVRDTLNKTVLKQNLFLIFQSQSQEKIREMEILIMRQLLKVLRKFKEISRIEFDKGFLEDIHMNYFNYFLNTIIDIALKYDPDIKTKIQIEALQIQYSLNNKLKQCTSENIFTASPSSHSAIFSLLKQFAEDIDNDLQLKFENQEFKCSQFYQEIVKLLMEKLQIQMQLGNINPQVSELNQFIQKLPETILLKQNNDQMIIENS